MSWAAIIVLAVLAYGCKVFGLFVLGPRTTIGPVADVVALLPAALFAAIVITNTFDTDGALAVDARLAGLAAAAVLTWRRAPFVLIVAVAMAVTALVRLAF